MPGKTTDDGTTPIVTTPKTPLLPVLSLEEAIDTQYTSTDITGPAIQPPIAFTYQNILSTGVGLVLESLYEENVELALELLTNMVR